MSIWFVSRHEGAIEWMKAQSQWHVDHFVAHLDVTLVKKNDVVIGVLPIALAAEVCVRNAEFYALVVPQTYNQRGNEHTFEDMKQAKCYLMRYDIRQIDY